MGQIFVAGGNLFQRGGERTIAMERLANFTDDLITAPTKGRRSVSVKEECVECEKLTEIEVFLAPKRNNNGNAALVRRCILCIAPAHLLLSTLVGDGH